MALPKKKGGHYWCYASACSRVDGVPDGRCARCDQKGALKAYKRKFGSARKRAALKKKGAALDKGKKKNKQRRGGKKLK